MATTVEDILDSCLEAQRRGEDPEAVLGAHPEWAGEVRPLLALAQELERLPAPQPSAEGLARAFARLAAEAAPRRRFFLLRRGWLAAAAALIAILACWGIVNSSFAAVPGDLLYPVKRFRERVSYVLTLGPEGKANLHLAFSDERLKEAVRKYQRGRGIDEGLLRAMLASSAAALERAEALPTTARAVFLQKVACSCQFQCRVLGELERSARGEELAAVRPFLEVCHARCRCMEDATACGVAPEESPAELAERIRQLSQPLGRER